MAQAPVAFPLGPPSFSGTLETVDVLLNAPNRITRDIAQLALQQFFAHRVFSAGPAVEGGAIQFELPPTLQTDLYSDRTVQEVAPGAEFPYLQFSRGVPQVSRARKFGGVFFVTREAVRRNDARALRNAMSQAGNTLALSMDALALATLAAAIAANSRTQSGQSWATAAAVTVLNRSGTNQALSDILIAQNVVAKEMRLPLQGQGFALDSIILHPDQNLALSEAYGPDGVDAALASAGITTRIVSTRNTAGTAILFKAGIVGFWSNEEGLLGETEYIRRLQRTDYQWSIIPVMGVDNPYAMIQLTGIA